MDMDLNNRLTEDETLEQAYDIFLELAADNLTQRISFFSICSLKSGGAELFDPAEDWQEHVDYDLNPDFFAEVVIGRPIPMAVRSTISSLAFCCAVKRSQAVPHSVA